MTAFRRNAVANPRLQHSACYVCNLLTAVADYSSVKCLRQKCTWLRRFVCGGTIMLVPLACQIPCQVIYSQFGLAIHQNDHQARNRFVEWAQNEVTVVPDFHKRIVFRDEAHFWLNGYVNKQNCRIWSEANS
ncbi:uncharacterized protein TNCV_3471391 [Trichonephila clavipes]|nr:uncharacterized protein TNCV_3471391 [Trichonephila clavipes]